jgi:hypothetical protein
MLVSAVRPLESRWNGLRGRRCEDWTRVSSGAERVFISLAVRAGLLDSRTPAVFHERETRPGRTGGSRSASGGDHSLVSRGDVFLERRRRYGERTGVLSLIESERSRPRELLRKSFRESQKVKDEIWARSPISALVIYAWL